MNTADILDKAAALIDKHGHCKGTHKNDAGALCTRGAVIRASSPRYSFTRNKYVPMPAADAMREFERHLLRTVGNWGPISWNDAPERTKEEVVSTLRAAAQAARAEA